MLKDNLMDEQLEKVSGGTENTSTTAEPVDKSENPDKKNEKWNPHTFD